MGCVKTAKVLEIDHVRESALAWMGVLALSALFISFFKKCSEVVGGVGGVVDHVLPARQELIPREINIIF